MLDDGRHDGISADDDIPLDERLAVAAHHKARRIARRAARVLHPHGHRYRIADDAIGRGIDHHQAPVEHIGLAGKQDMHGRLYRHRVQALRQIVHLSVRQHDRARGAAARNIAERFG